MLETQWMFNQYLLLMVLARGVLTLAPTFTRAGYEAMPHLFVILKLSVPLTPFLPIHKEILLSPLGSDLLWHHQSTHKVLVIHFLDTARWVSSLPETFTDSGGHLHRGCSGCSDLNPVFSPRAPDCPSRPFTPEENSFFHQESRSLQVGSLSSPSAPSPQLVPAAPIIIFSPYVSKWRQTFSGSKPGPSALNSVPILSLSSGTSLHWWRLLLHLQLPPLDRHLPLSLSNAEAFPSLLWIYKNWSTIPFLQSCSPGKWLYSPVLHTSLTTYKSLSLFILYSL